MRTLKLDMAKRTSDTFFQPEHVVNKAAVTSYGKLGCTKPFQTSPTFLSRNFDASESLSYELTPKRFTLGRNNNRAVRSASTPHIQTQHNALITHFYYSFNHILFNKILDNSSLKATAIAHTVCIRVAFWGCGAQNAYCPLIIAT
jgi:hypothetical protein